MALLRFIYLTLPNCTGNLLKTLSKEEKQEKSTKKQKDEFTRLQLAMASSKSKQRQESIFTRLLRLRRLLAELNNSKEKKKQELAKQKQQEGTSTVIPSLTTIPEEDTMAGIGQNPSESNQNMNQCVMPCWTSPRRLAHLGKDKEKQVELKSRTIQLVSNHPFAGLD